MGRCSSSTCKTCYFAARTKRNYKGAYQQSTGDLDEDRAVLTSGLRVKGRNLVLDLLEGKVLQASSAPTMSQQAQPIVIAYAQTVHNAASALGGVGLEGQHGLVALETGRISMVFSLVGMVSRSIFRHT